MGEEKEKINWSEYALCFHEKGQNYQYGSGSSWDYKSELFPIEAGKEYTWGEMRLRIDKIDDEKREIYFTYFSNKDEQKGFSDKLWVGYKTYTLKSYSNSGGANDFFWVDSNNLEICFVKKDEQK